MDSHMFFKIRENYLSSTNCFILWVNLPECLPHEQVLKIIMKSKGNYCNREVSITKELADHNNIVECYTFLEDSQNNYIFMERCYKDTLMHYIASSRKLLTDIQLIYSMKSISKCLKIMHESKISHRDIKPENILITNDGSFRLSDFGISKRYSSKFDTTNIGTSGYVSPEHKSRRASDCYKNDIWGFGVSFFELAIKKNAGELNNLNEKQINEAVDTIKFCDDIKFIFKKCLKYDPDNRVNATELYKDIKKVASNLYEQKIQCKEDYYNMIQLNFPNKCIEPKTKLNSIRKVFISRRCLTCKESYGDIKYRYFHSMHLNCILKEINKINITDSDCFICKEVYHETKEPLEEISKSNLKLFRTKNCKKNIGQENPNSVCYHVMVMLTKNFCSKLFTCLHSKLIFCSLCSQNEHHIHCIGRRIFFENFDPSRSSMIYSSKNSEVYLQYYNIFSKWKNSDTKQSIRPQSCYVLKKMRMQDNRMNTNWINNHHIASQGNNCVMKLHYWFFKDNYIYIYYDYAEGKTLEKELAYRQLTGNTFDNYEIYQLAITLYECLNYLHSIKLYHQNIDLNSIFIKNNEYKLGKFNQCCYVEKGSQEKAAADYNMAANVIERMFLKGFYPSQEIYNYFCYFKNIHQAIN